MSMTYGVTEILHKTDDFFLFQKKRINRPWSAENTAAINTYFQHYIKDTSGDLTKNRGPLSGRYSLYIQSLTDFFPGKH